ncbi:nuclear transport factor 2 family protein [Meiothermus granaticius]|uniref:SnoaL-like domain protein n=1 Tax=Meiothermus granaticius NBRC 107808 TaxID=1227551 RepID=A0A399FEW7_9DEIN|nr:nuclear transport factor 2 family protein [Meiothermus granaticius]MCL6525606.1 nuclear transport factor 2 family protein [Thermaceae bacterium]RIH93712.1 SnoaL-like domain protein [Meiothermus granaticius NBRC 107808]GEM85764.1 hypothetical protein MGR01S_03890 [Meiothermus granaticius NBRC 107808]
MNLPPQETLVRELFGAFAGHDLATLQILLSPAFVLHVPDHLPCAGSYRGWEGVLRFWREMAHQGKSALEAEIQRVLTGPDYAAVLANDHTEPGKSRVVYVLRLEEGRVAECWMHT